MSRKFSINKLGRGEKVGLNFEDQQQLFHQSSAHFLADKRQFTTPLIGDFSLLLTGDAGEDAEQAKLASDGPLQSLVYKAGHHGANTSSSALFLEAVRPQFVIISAGEGNTYGHPNQEMLNRAEEVGAAVLRTDQQGRIEVITDGQVMWWEMNE